MNVSQYLKLMFCGCVVFMSACAVNYKDLHHRDQVHVPNSSINNLSYRVKDLPVFATSSGLQGIEDSLKNSNLFQTSEELFEADIPAEGTYIYVEPTYVVPTVAAVGFGYLSFSSLTVLPAWSNHDGYKVTYTLYNNGEMIKTFQYERKRFVAVWAPIIALSWINLLTPSEYDAFSSTTNEFLEDVQPVLSRL